LSRLGYNTPSIGVARPVVGSDIIARML
jgi:hypothetical protein